MFTYDGIHLYSIIKEISLNNWPLYTQEKKLLVPTIIIIRNGKAKSEV